MESGKYLFIRYGGIGDLAPITAVCRYIKEKGMSTHTTFLCRREVADILRFNRFIDEVIEIERLNGNMDCVRYGDFGWTPIDTYVYTQDFNYVYDFKNTVEGNPFSNDDNWFDDAYGIVGIERHSVADEYKRPVYFITDEEVEWAQAERKEVFGENKFITCVIGGSSFLRTWRDWPTFFNMFHEKYPDYHVLVFGQPKHSHFLPYEDEKPWIKVALEDYPTRKAVALMNESEAAVCMDSGMMHMAEAIELHSIAMFSTVRAWTRSKYYKYVRSIDESSDCPEAPCCSLDTWCPVDKTILLKKLNVVQRELWENTFSKEVDPMDQLRHSGVYPPTFSEEWNFASDMHKEYTKKTPKCLQSHRPEDILNALSEIL